VKGVSADTLLDAADTDAKYVSAWCDGGYTTDLPFEDPTGGRAWIAYEFGGEPLQPEHGGPARLWVPYLYVWKSAKQVRGLELLDHDKPGFWEPTAATTTVTHRKSSATRATDRSSGNRPVAAG
jgi:DMSO/TMAO reductase YedYZ molybdopterin-dependent catalytic subunit